MTTAHYVHRNIQRVIRALIACVVASAVFSVHGASRPLVLLNATVHTGQEQQPRAEAIVIEDGRIAYVGTSDEASQKAPADAQRIDLTGLTVVPGLTDAHMHLAGVGFRELSFDLEGTASLKELQARLRERAAQTPAGQWISGRGWLESQWSPAAFPTKEDLDAVVADKPVILTRADGHAAVANSVALRLARIDRRTRNPRGGEILKDARTGEPTGMLIDHAMELVQKLVPEPTREDIARALEVAAERSVRLGWTQVHIAGNSFSEIDLIRQLMREDRIKLRIYNAVDGPGADARRLLRQGPLASAEDGRFTLRSIKLYIDGALGSRGAALLEPYSDAPGSTGLLVNSEKALEPVLRAALVSGIQIQTHAIGDRGNRLVLDLYERAFQAVPPAQRKVAEPRWRIEHAQVISPPDLARFAKLGVIASMQPSHAISDLYFAPARLGPARLTGGYAWRSLLDSGATIAAGSDAPVERGEPMIEFYAAVARRALNGFAGADWHPEQRVSRAEALKMMTLAPAYAAFQENERGTIEPGKIADLTVLSADIMAIPEQDILKTRCVMTLIGGDVVYADAALNLSTSAQRF